MENHWYYVEGKDRIGPVEQNDIEKLIKQHKLNEKSYVWRKGMENWTLLKEVEEFSIALGNGGVPVGPAPIPSSIKKEFNWDNVNENKRIFSIKIGIDRGAKEAVEYGPFNVKEMKKLIDEKRVNQKTLVFAPGFESWLFLGDIDFFKEEDGMPPVIEETDRRQNKRRPFVARMFFHDELEVYEGVCRDISVGGMQVLVSEFPGTVGDKISMNVHPTNTEFSFVANGQIVRKLEGNQGFSLRFFNLTDEAQSSIARYLEESD